MKKTFIVSMLILFLFISITSYAHEPGEDYSYGPWMMWGHGFGWFWPFMLIIPIIFIIGIIFLIRRLIVTADRNRTMKTEESALDILRKRYARGEIDRDEFQQKRDDLNQ